MLNLKYAVFEDCIYRKKAERKFYHYCALRQMSLWRYAFLFFIWNVLHYFHFINDKKYFEKRWSFLSKVKNYENRLERFSAKAKRKVFIPDNGVEIVTLHPVEIVSKIVGHDVIGSEYDKDTCKFVDGIANPAKYVDLGYTAYGRLSSPLMKNADEKVYVYGKRLYKSKTNCVTTLFIRYIVAFLIIVVSSLFWAVVSMHFSASSFAESEALFQSYFDSIMLIVLNFLPVFILCFGLWLITNSLTLSCTVSGALTLILSLINYYKLMFRNDPFMFEDIALINEAGNISSRYNITVGAKIILLFSVILLFIFILRCFCEARIRIRYIRPVLLIALCFVSVSYAPWYLGDELYNKNENPKCINQWSSTEQFISRGFIYPFLHSYNSTVEVIPEGFSEEECERTLDPYEYTDIPEDKRVNIISIMLEAYTDFERFNTLEFTDNIYDSWNKLKEESYHGYLVTDIFAAGTVMTERQFLTGMNKLPNFRSKTNSYVWYLRDQGYTVEGSHPCYNWFYNRVNINEYLGFQRYLFDENYYYDFSGMKNCTNNILIPEITNQYKQAVGRGEDYFSFSVTYQGHGPYEDNIQWFDHEYVKKKDGYTDGDYNILNNYFHNIDATNRAISDMVEELRYDDEPVIVILFGDHMPWLGNNNSVYYTLGIDFDFETKEGFGNYYKTPYIVWANEKAKEVTGNNFCGDGGDIGPYFLMNRVFDMLGWKGDRFMQYMNDMNKDLLAVTQAKAVYTADGTFTYDPDADLKEKLDNFEKMQYLRKKDFVFGDVK